MLARVAFCLVFLGPLLAMAAEPVGIGRGDEQLANARDLLRNRLAEAERLQGEIERLRELAGEPPPNVSVRVRVFEVSLTKIKNVGVPGLDWPGRREGSTAEFDRKLAGMFQQHLARLLADETLTVADGTEAQVHAGDIKPNDLPEADTHQAEPTFSGTEILLTPRTQNDGRLSIEIVYCTARPDTRPNQAPQARVHEISTVVKLAPGEAIILDGAKEERLSMQVRGPGVLVDLGLGRHTQSVNEVQTFVVVSREPQRADKRTARAR